MASRGRGEEAVVLDVGRLDLAPGEARAVELDVPFADLSIGGERYVPDPRKLRTAVEVAQSASGWHFRLKSTVTLTGPCWRCLGEASLSLSCDVRDFAAFGRQSGIPYDEDLDCEFLASEILDVTAMVRDGLVDLIPAAILCRDDCAGLCPMCGQNKNEAPCECRAETVDPRWAALEQVAQRLRSNEE